MFPSVTRVRFLYHFYIKLTNGGKGANRMCTFLGISLQSITKDTSFSRILVLLTYCPCGFKLYRNGYKITLYYYNQRITDIYL